MNLGRAMDREARKKLEAPAAFRSAGDPHFGKSARKMPGTNEFHDSWNLRAASVACIGAALGGALCVLGLTYADDVLCTLAHNLVVGNVAGLAIAACAGAFGWKWRQRMRARR